MKTKANLFLLTALLAGFALVSCKEVYGPDRIMGEFGVSATGGDYTITLNPVAYNNDQAPMMGYVRAYVKDAQGEETLVNRANEGDVVWLQASAYEGFDFMQWFPSNNVNSLTESEADITSFVMPAGDATITVWFDDRSIPMPTAVQFLETTLVEDKNKQENVKLRAWKAEQTSQVFVWFDAWSGRMNSGANSMRGMPDEVSLISNWGQPKWGLSSWQKADMQYMQQVKGAKVVLTLFSAKVGEDVEADPAYSTIGTSSDEALIRPVIAKYARQIYLNCIKEGYDGYDWDFEPDVSQKSVEEAPLWKVPQQADIFLQELSYYFGTKAQTYTEAERQANGIDRRLAYSDDNIGKTEDGDSSNRGPRRRLLLIVDGEVHDASFSSGVNNSEATAYVDYYVQQAYDIRGASSCNARIQGIITQLQGNIDKDLLTMEEAVGRCILTENFEDQRNLNDGQGLLDMASVKTFNNFPIGGFGAYRVGLSYEQGYINEASYSSPGWDDATGNEKSTHYVWLRKGIDLQYGTATDNPRE